jgi:hypothetical protein
MRFFASLADWLVQRVFWLSIVAMASTVQADVILWQQAPGSGLNQLAQINAGEMRSQAIDLAQAARVERITLDLRGGLFAPPQSMSLWFGSTAGSRGQLVYSGGLQTDWSGLAFMLPQGRSWLSVEALAGSGQITWLSPVGSTGGAFVSSTGAVTSGASYVGTVRGVAVPEPSVVPVVIVAGIVGAGIVWRRCVYHD